MTKTELTAALETAIDKTQCAIGAWSVNSGDEYVQLVWTCDADDAPEMYGDEPWSHWGGKEIIEAACATQFDESGIDGYVDKYGDKVVAQWVQWSIE